MSSKKQISVIGATGKLGVPVVKNLIDFGYTVKVIVRNREKANRVFGDLPGLEVVMADLQDPLSLQTALEATEYLYLNLSTNTIDRTIPFAEEREGVANILEAIDRKSIRQILMISGLGALDNHQGSERFDFIPNIIRKEGHKLIKDSGIPYTILHCSTFVDNFVLYLRKGMYSIIGNPTFPIYFTNCYDYALQLSNAIGNEAAFYKEFPIQGVSGIAHSKAAQVFFTEYNPDIKVKVLPNAVLSILSRFNKEMKFVKHMADYFSFAPEEFLAEDHQTYKVLGKPVTDLEGYAMELKKREFYSYLNN